MPAPQPSLSTRARWIIGTQLAAVRPGRKHTPGIHTRATGFLPLTSPARDAVAVAFREARRDGHRHCGPATSCSAWPPRTRARPHARCGGWGSAGSTLPGVRITNQIRDDGTGRRRNEVTNPEWPAALGRARRGNPRSG